MFMSALHFGGGPTDVVLADEVLTQHGDTDESEEQRRAQVAYERFLQVLQREPKPGTALDRVYGFHVERGTLAAFISSLQRKATSRESSDDIGAAWMLLGLVELQRGKDSEAAVAFREAEAIRTNDALASWLLGSSLHRLGQLTSATAAYERAITRSPEKTSPTEEPSAGAPGSRGCANSCRHRPGGDRSSARSPQCSRNPREPARRA